MDKDKLGPFSGSQRTPTYIDNNKTVSDLIVNLDYRWRLAFQKRKLCNPFGLLAT